MGINEPSQIEAVNAAFRDRTGICSLADVSASSDGNAQRQKFKKNIKTKDLLI
jgi:hypothetical protein